MLPVRKTFFVFFIAFLIFLLIVPVVSYKTFKSALQDEIFKHLITTRELLLNQIESYFHERFGDIDVLARNPIIAQSFSQLVASAKTSGVGSSQYSTIARLYQPLMEYYVSDYGYVNIFFVGKDGDVIYSVSESEYKGHNLKTSDYSIYSIAQAFNSGLEEVTFEDYTWNDKREEFTSFFAAPIYDNEELIGVVIIEIPFSRMDSILTNRAGLGETGEMYLVGDDGFMRSNSRFSEEPTLLKKEVDTESTRDAFNGHIGIKIIKDYRDVSVLSAYTPLNLKSVNWVLIVEIDKKEAFSTIRFVEIWLSVIATLLGIISCAYIYLSNKIEKMHHAERGQ